MRISSYIRSALTPALGFLISLSPTASFGQVTFENNGDGTESVIAGKLRVPLDGRQGTVVATYRTYVLISSWPSGLACAATHYIVDLSGPDPALSDSFGGCQESLDLVRFADGEIVFRADLSTGPTKWVYHGGKTVVERVGEALKAGSISLDASQEAFERTHPATLLAASEWKSLLEESFGSDLDQLEFFFSGPSEPFVRQGDWYVAHGCGESMCGQRFAVLAIHALSHDPMVVRVNRDAQAVDAIGPPISPLPQMIRGILTETASEAALQSFRLT